jgi:surface antigen
MRKISTTLASIAIMSNLLTGCAQGPKANATPQEAAATSCTAFGPKTQTGAVAGALVGALIGGLKGGGKGALIGGAAGAAAGGLAGKVMDHNDCQAAQVAMKQMETARIGAPIAWNNPSTGNSGVFVPTSASATSANGQVCRNYSRQAVVGGQASGTEQGVTCRNADGDWVAVS